MQEYGVQEEKVLFGPKRLSEFVTVLAKAPSMPELAALQAEGVRAVLDTRQAGEDAADLAPDELASALSERGMAYGRLPLSRTQVDEEILERFGEVIRSVPKPLVLVSLPGAPGAMFALAHIANEQGMPGEAMLEAASAMGLPFGSRELRGKIAAYVDRKNKRPNKLVRRAVEARLGAPAVAEQHRRAVVMHAEAKAVAEPVSLVTYETKMQIAAGLSAAGLLGALLVDRRLLLLPIVGLGYIVSRIWPLITGPVVAAAETMVPDNEVRRLREKLESLQAAG